MANTNPDFSFTEDSGAGGSSSVSNTTSSDSIPAMVAWYPLTTETQFANHGTGVAPKYDKITDDGAMFVQIASHDKSADGMFASTDAFETSKVTKGTNTWTDFTNITPWDGVNYEFIYVDDSGIERRWSQTVHPNTATYADTLYTSSKFTAISNIGESCGGMYKLNSATFYCINNSRNGDWWGAIGCWTTYSSGFPGYPSNITTTLKLYMRIGYEIKDDTLKNSSTAVTISRGDNTRCGSAAQFGGSSYLYTDNIFKLEKRMSFSFWCSFNNVDSAAFLLDFRNSSNQGYQPFYTSGSSLQIYSTSTGTHNYTYKFTKNLWYHIIVTIDENYSTIYINNKKMSQSANARGSDWSNTYSYFTLGARYSKNQGYLNGQMNDIRIYNYVLSAKERSELYKGCILHYDFNETINKDPLAKYSASAIGATDLPIGTGGQITLTKTFGEYFGRRCWKITYSISSTTVWTGAYIAMNPYSNGIAEGETATRSCQMYLPSGQASPNHFALIIEGSAHTNKSYVQYDKTKCDTWQQVSMTATVGQSGSWCFYLVYYPASSTPNITDFTVYMTDFQLELGPKATAYTDQTSISTIYDSSGFGHHATVSVPANVQITSDSMCGSNSLVADNVSFSLSNQYLDSSTYQDHTVLCWWYKSESAGNQRLVNMNTGYYTQLSTNDKPIVYINSGNNDHYMYGGTIEAGNWYLLGFVYQRPYIDNLTNDDILVKMYINGESSWTRNMTSKSNPVTATGMPTSLIFLNNSVHGLISDIQIFRRAFTDEEMLEMYNSKAQIDKNGNIYAKQFIEGSATAKVPTKQAEVKGSGFAEWGERAKIFKDNSILANQLYEN